jgi:ribosomal protein L4
MLVWQQYKQGLPKKVRKRGFSSVLTFVRNSEEIMKVAGIEMYGFYGLAKGAVNNTKFSTRRDYTAELLCEEADVIFPSRIRKN